MPVFGVVPLLNGLGLHEHPAASAPQGGDEPIEVAKPREVRGVPGVDQGFLASSQRSGALRPARWPGLQTRDENRALAGLGHERSELDESGRGGCEQAWVAL